MRVSFDFVEPWWLLFLLVLPWVWAIARHGLSGIRGSRRIASLVLRSLVIVLCVFALARMRLRIDNDRRCVLFVIDRSESIPPRMEQEILRRIRVAQDERDRVRGDKVGVVIFGANAGIEEPARERDLELLGFSTIINTEGTNIDGALRLALAAFPEDVGSRRIVLFSDGNETAGRAEESARDLRAAGIQVDVVPIDYRHESEIAVAKVVAPPDVRPGEPFSVQVVIESSRDTEIKLRVFENGQLMAQADDVREVRAGKNYFELAGFRQDETGAHEIEVQIEPIAANDDSLSENNIGRAATIIHGEARVLLCSPAPDEEANLIAALRREKIEVDVIEPFELPRTAGDWLQYSAVIFSNVGAHHVPEEKQKLIENLVGGTGLGFVMIGGENSFGAGGWQGTPIEKILPVNLELDQKKVLPNGALAMVVHSCEMDNGNYWARQIIQQAIATMSPKDYAGVIYYDNRGQESWLFPMLPCSERNFMYGKLVGFEPGDMLTFQTILTMAHEDLRRTKASLKHIVMLTDGDPAEPSSSLVSQIVDESRISISVICYGAHGGMVPTNMEKLAARAGGRFHFLRGPEELPEIFLREASVVRKALVSEEPFQPALRTSHDILRGIQGLPGLDGHVLTSPRAGAELVLVRPSTAETPIDDPLLAAWTYSLGKVVAFTSDAGRRWGGQWTSWEGYGPYWSQLVRWVSRAEQSSFYRVDHRVEDGKLTVVAELITPDGRFVNGAALEGRVITPGRDGEVRRFELQQTGPGRYVGPELPLEQSGTYAVHLDAEVEGFALPYRFAVPLSYSPEYRALATDHDRLARIAEAGGGRVVSLGEPIDAFAGELPSRKSVEEVWRTLLLCALILFFLDVAVRRIAIDPRAAARRVHEWAHARALKRREATAPADERLSSLLRAKERVRESRFRDTRASGAGASVSTMSEGATSQTAVEEPVFDARDEARASEPEPKAPEPARKDDASVPRRESDRRGGEEESYTSRLLRAKKRALGEAGGESNDSKKK